MKILVCNIVCMLAIIVLGKRSKRMGIKQYVIVGSITLLQVAFSLFYAFTMQVPPLY